MTKDWLQAIHAPSARSEHYQIFVVPHLAYTPILVDRQPPSVMQKQNRNYKQLKRWAEYFPEAIGVLHLT